MEWILGGSDPSCHVRGACRGVRMDNATYSNAPTRIATLNNGMVRLEYVPPPRTRMHRT